MLPGGPLVVLDEIHKFKNWRNLIKGFYDKKKDVQKFLVTGSARLDHYRRGGDSLLGRYRYLRLLGKKSYEPEEGIKILPFVEFCKDAGLV